MLRRAVLLLWLVGLLFVVAACQQQPAPTATKPPEPTKPPAAQPSPTKAEAAQPTPTKEEAMPKEGEPYKLGLVLSITGPASALGVPERDTALMLMEKINAAGGIKGPDGLMHKLEVIVEDDATDTGQAVLATKKLIEQDKVHVIIGSSVSPNSIAMAPVVSEAEIPMISLASSTAIVHPLLKDFEGQTIQIPGKGEHTVGPGETVIYLSRLYDVDPKAILEANPQLPQELVRPWVFKTPQENYPVAQVQADYWKAKGVTKVGSLGVNNAFGLDSRLAMKAVYPKAGIEIVADELFQPKDKDFRAQLTKIKGLDPEGVVVHATPGEGAPITVQFRELGFDVPLVHNHGIGSKAFIDLAGQAAEGVLFPAGKLLVAETLPDDDPQKPVLLQYIEDYDKYTNGAPRSTFGGHAWDAVMISVQCLEKVGPEASALRDCFENDVKDFVGITGIFTWSPVDHVGIFKESLALIMIKDGNWVFVAPDEYANVP